MKVSFFDLVIRIVGLVLGFMREERIPDNYCSRQFPLG